jgi:hypothetical protein
MGPNISLEYISIPYNDFYTKQEDTKIALSLYIIVFTEDFYDIDINMVVDLSAQAMKNLLSYYNSIPFLQ